MTNSSNIHDIQATVGTELQSVLTDAIYNHYCKKQNIQTTTNFACNVFIAGYGLLDKIYYWLDVIPSMQVIKSSKAKWAKYYYFTLMAIFPGEPRSAGSPSGPPPSVQKQNVWGSVEQGSFNELDILPVT